MPAGGLAIRSRAASGISLPALRPGREVLSGLGQAGAGNTRVTAQGLRPPVGASVSDRALRPRPRKPGLKLSLGDESPSGKSRGGTPTDVLPVPSPLAGGWGQRPGPLARQNMRIASVGVPHPFFFLGLVAWSSEAGLGVQRKAGFPPLPFHRAALLRASRDGFYKTRARMRRENGSACHEEP